jgi:uncharacterized delta-60 repeat protein
VFKPASIRTRKAGRWVVLAACLFAVLLINSAQATPGGLDPTFGANGKVTTSISWGGYDDYGYGLALQPDGNIVVAGRSFNVATAQDFGLVRYKPDGSLDASFNGTGKVTTAFGSGVDEASDLALQSDGKLVAAGYSNNGFNYDFAVARYKTDGSLDTSFKGTGKVTTPFALYDDLAYALALQPDGKLVVAGRSFNGSNADFALARYKPDGSLDTAFNGTGKVTTAIGPSDDEAYGLALQPDGKVVAAGLSRNGSQTVFAVARYNPNGSLDTSFNGTGKVTTAIGSTYASADALALQPDGKLVAAGIGQNGSNFDFALARYNPNGSLDTSFNGTGKVTTAIGPSTDDAIDLALQPDGKLVAAGYSDNGSEHDFALARYNANGTLDPGFGSGGKVTTAIGSGTDEAYGLALQPDGKLVAAGQSWNGSKYVFALVRYLGNTLTVAKTGSGSGSVTSSPTGIDCGSSCSAPYAAVPVTLTATAAAGSSFAGWTGDCSGTGPCTLTVSADHAATARFETDKTLTLAKAGSGTGTVTSGPAGHTFTHGTVVTLTAAASSGSTFAGWSGDCSGKGACTLTMNADQAATARFETDKTLTLAKAGSGTGTVTSSPAGISCGTICAHTFPHGTLVTLTAAASSRSRFAGWSGACSGTGSCTLTLSAARSVTATFKVLCVVPKVKGKTVRAAKRAIGKAHCSLGRVTRAFSANVRKGRVISQKPKPGAKRPAGSKVSVKVSKGKNA